MQDQKLTDAHVIALAAADLHRRGSREFSEWDLTLRAWQRDNNRFGCRGYEEEYPDHKRVMMAIAKSKPAIRDGWIERVRTNYYRITPLGLAVAERIEQLGPESARTERSPGPIYLAVEPYVSSSLFVKFAAKDLDRISWYDAEAFLGITEYSREHLENRLSFLHNSVQEARSWFENTRTEEMRSGPSGGAACVSKGDVNRLIEVLNYLEREFAEQFAAIRAS